MITYLQEQYGFPPELLQNIAAVEGLAKAAAD
jgi:alanyl-tRNA synthetase